MKLSNFVKLGSDSQAKMPFQATSLSKSMLSKCGKFGYFSKVGERFPKYSQSVLEIILGFPTP